MDGALRDERIGRFTDVPVHSVNERSIGIEKILAVFQIQDREIQVRALIVYSRNVNNQVTLLAEKSRSELLVFLQLAGAGSGELFDKVGG